MINVRGATSGIGFHTALALASKGARVIVTGRSKENGRKAIDETSRLAGHDQIEFIAVDHSF